MTILFLMLGLAFCQRMPAQEIHFRRYGMEEGLVHSGTGSREVILQDREGFLWFSTHHGISRFDGMTFKNFRYDPGREGSLGDNYTIGMVEADDGKIWVGTPDEGLFVFNPLTETFEPDSAAAEICSIYLNTFNKDRDGNIWIGTRFNSFCRWNKSTGQFEKIGDLPDGQHFFQARDGTIWLGALNGLHRLLPDGTLRHMAYPPGVPENWRYRVVQEVEELPDGKLILTSSFSGFWEFDPATETFRDLTAEFRFERAAVPYSFLADDQGKLWIGADGELWHWDPSDRSAQIYRYDEKVASSVPATMIPSMRFDRSGSLWLITRQDGIAVAHDLDQSFEQVGRLATIQLLPLDATTLIVWAYDGIYQLDIPTKELRPFDLPIEGVRGALPRLLRYSDRELLIYEGKGSRPKLFNLETKALRLLPPAYYSIHLAAGRIWDAFSYYDETQDEWVDALPEFQRNIPGFDAEYRHNVAILPDTGSSIWVATTRGLFHYNLASGAGKAYRHDPSDRHSLPSNVCQPMFPGADRRLYVPTTNGLAIYDPEKDRFDNYNYKNGLSYDVVATVVEDAAGNPWIGTEGGLQKLDRETGVLYPISVYDGLPGEAIASSFGERDAAGRLYFQTGDVLFRFHPDSLPVRDDRPPIYLMDLFLITSR